MNARSLILAIALGFASWLWAFMIVGSTFVDMATGEPKPFVFEYYVAMLTVNAAVTVIIIALYMWKYGEKHPIIPDRWVLDAVVFGFVLCVMNFLLDAVFFGALMQRDLVSYFWLETTTGYFYPSIVLETLIIAWLIYGRKA